MKVTDMNGFTIEVTDLDTAIAQSAQYVEFHQGVTGLTPFEQKMFRYWTDMHGKLTAIRSEREATKTEDHGK